MSVDILHTRVMHSGDDGGFNNLTAAQVIELIHTYQASPLPDGNRVFPWLHGLSKQVCPQTLYFCERVANTREIPEMLIPIKVGDSKIQIINSIAPADVLQTQNKRLVPVLLQSDPDKGVNLRNLRFQPAKCITHATILVYSFDDPATIIPIVEMLQQALGPKTRILTYTGTISELDEIDPSALTEQEKFVFNPSVPSVYTQWDLNFQLYERLEILHMSTASPVPLGDATLYVGNGMDPTFGKWHTLVECVPHAIMPTVSRCDHYIRSVGVEDTRVVIDFPASDTLDPASLSAKDVVTMLNVCKAVYTRSHGKYTLAISPEGYKGNTLFVILYSMFCTRKGMADVFTYLHRDLGRPLLCSDLDIEVFRTLEAIFCEFSPSSDTAKESKGAISASKVALAFGRLTEKMYEVPTDAFVNFNGSLPSRILDYMYLGALRHAQYPDFLAQLGISRILSIGEKLPWLEYVEGQTIYKNPHKGIDEALYFPDILDDGVDSLLPILDQCLEFLDVAHRTGKRTLVHCRVGVSRSAAICIAEVMRRKEWSLPKSYLFVRVRRLHLIIQPNLRFLYDLVKLEEHMNIAKGRSKIREMEWPVLCREISRINS